MANGILFTEEQKKKYDYVRTTLTEMLRKILQDERFCADYVVMPNGDEIVAVSFNNKHSVKKHRCHGRQLAGTDQGRFEILLRRNNNDQ